MIVIAGLSETAARRGAELINEFLAAVLYHRTPPPPSTCLHWEWPSAHRGKDVHRAIAAQPVANTLTEIAHATENHPTNHHVQPMSEGTGLGLRLLQPKFTP